MRQGYYAEPKSEHSLLVPILHSLQTQNETILKLLQEKPAAFTYIDKPSSRLSLRRLSNEEKFILKVRDILKQGEGLRQFELLSALGRRKDDKTALRWLHGYDGIYWRANITGALSPAYSYSLIEE